MDEKRQIIYWSIGLVGLGAATGLTYYFIAKKRAKKSVESVESLALSFSSPSASPSPAAPQTISEALALFNTLPDGTYPIRFGQKSKKAFILQAALGRFGYDLKVDGNPGPKTFDTVKKLDAWVRRTFPNFQPASFTSQEIPKSLVSQIVARLQFTVKTPQDAAIVRGITNMFNQYP